ncbi:LysR family transcriptional regulator [Microbulbifer agarilyticus]|uniref:LysR family transcriptional regulator n=1 Tax=Microbulbifer agarilyticus TaxID=260552 RepID=A0A1Q2MA15_9GAMM|nr:LysR family transcriptional regulator [Microbulbifer agarilyticus]AQQ69052.1 LysR family transcriptional regulator [Microbulbifer agarilyticus]
MNPHRIDLNLFVVIDTIYRERNLTRAAEQLHLTQPAVSNALGRAREALNDELFVRTPQGMQPTVFTEAIIAQVKSGLQQLHQSATSNVTFDPASAEKTIRLSMNDLTETMLLPALVERLQQAAPNMQVESYNVPREQLERELASHSLDFAIDVPIMGNTQLQQHPLGKDHFVCMLRRDHPQITDTLTLDDYLALQHIHISSRRSGPGLVDLQLNKLGRRRKITLRAQHYRIAPMIVETSNLALSAPSSFASRYNVDCFDLPFPVPKIESCLLWHKNAEQDPAHQWLRDLIIETLDAG